MQGWAERNHKNFVLTEMGCQNPQLSGQWKFQNSPVKN
jgi:hypothetical protein